MELASERLRLRRVSLEEARTFVRGETPATIACAPGYPTPDTPDAFASQVSGRDSFGPWLIVRAADGVAIGDIGLAPDEEAGTFSGGYGIAASARGQGFATEALSTLVDALWAHRHDAARIVLDTDVANAASRRVMEKAGFRPLRRERDLLYYALDRTSAPGG
jgi:RimJ/RimL family protein N-acetyltransferase